MSFHMPHLSYGNYIVRVNGVMTTWPLASFRGSTALDLQCRVCGKNILYITNENKYWRYFLRTLMILSLLVSRIYRAF